MCCLANHSAEAQSSQAPFPAQSQRPDETKPLEDKTVQGAQQQHNPTAAEISKNETVGSAFLRGLQYQEYETRSAAEAMPDEIGLPWPDGDEVTDFSGCTPSPPMTPCFHTRAAMIKELRTAGKRRTRPTSNGRYPMRCPNPKSDFTAERVR